MTGPAAAWTGTRPISSLPTSRAPLGKPARTGTLPSGGHDRQTAAHGSNPLRTAASNLRANRRSGRLATPRRSPVEARRLVSLRAASRARHPGIRGEVIDGDVADYHHKGGRSRPGPGWFSAVGWVLLLAG